MKRPSPETTVMLALSLVVLFLAGAAIVALLNTGAPRAPEPVEPADGTVVATRTPTFRWRSASGTTFVEFWLVPEGPAAGIRLVQENRGAFTVPPPEQWCCLREGVTYRWQVRASDSPIPLAPEDQYWGPWSEERRFTVAAP